MSLLDDRGTTLASLPVDSFAFEAERLVSKPNARLSDVRWDFGRGNSDVAAQDKTTLTTTELSVVETMRAQASGMDAYAVGEDLSEQVRDYVAGAVAFRGQDLAQAALFFRKVLQSPPSSSSLRAVWAAYMLGRTLAASNDNLEAAEAFARTRDLVANGAPDPLELAVASFGEEARLALDASGLPITSLKGGSIPAPTLIGIIALHRAVELYARQAAYSSEGGIDSLRMVAEFLLSETPSAEPWLAQAVSDALLRHLLIAYALASADPVPDERPQLSADGKRLTRVIERLADAYSKASFDDVDTGRLAALAYLGGSYEAAAQFAGNAHGTLAAWVRAKLSLQGGDLAATAHAYDEAIQKLATSPQAMTPETTARMRGESGVVAVARGDFEQALEVLYPQAAYYWGDVAYVAERLLTTDQLRRFVDEHVAAVAISPRHDTLYAFGTGDFDSARALRDLLARRLVRDGQLELAAKTFTTLDLRQHVTGYRKALHRAQAAFWRSDRARGAWDAAIIARDDGMDMSGTELQPDMQVLEGASDVGFGPRERSLAEPLVTSSERRLFAESSPKPDRRYHYRYVAVEHAILAAADLPFRSQAYAAILCRASEWMFQSNDDVAAQELYRLYVSHGAVVSFATHFGHACPSPDFQEAASLRWRLPMRHIHSLVDHHWLALTSLVTLLLLGMSAALLVSSRRRYRI